MYYLRNFKNGKSEIKEEDLNYILSVDKKTGKTKLLIGVRGDLYAKYLGIDGGFKDCMMVGEPTKTGSIHKKIKRIPMISVGDYYEGTYRVYFSVKKEKIKKECSDKMAVYFDNEIDKVEDLIHGTAFEMCS